MVDHDGGRLRFTAKGGKAGYRVHYERRERSLLVSEVSPDRDRPAFATEAEAWKRAALIGLSDVVNVFVVHASDFTPVPGYESRTLNRYPNA